VEEAPELESKEEEIVTPVEEEVPRVDSSDISKDPEFIEATENESDSSSSFLSNFVLFTGFIGAAYLWNKK
jgi:hypothetical protein